MFIDDVYNTMSISFIHNNVSIGNVASNALNNKRDKASSIEDKLN